MRILLLGEYSNVHWTLAEGLRSLGHEVCVASNGDNWKNYRRDIDLSRKSTSRYHTISYLLNVLRAFRQFKGYDIVQLINPIFLDFRAKRIRKFYDYLRRHNGKIFLGAFLGVIDCFFLLVFLDIFLSFWLNIKLLIKLSLLKLSLLFL